MAVKRIAVGVAVLVLQASAFAQNGGAICRGASVLPTICTENNRYRENAGIK